jgi:hypothetical protein
VGSTSPLAPPRLVRHLAARVRTMRASSRSGSPRWVQATLRIRKAAPSVRPARLARRLPTRRDSLWPPLGGATRPRGAEPSRRDWLRSRTTHAAFPQGPLRAWALAASRRQALVARSSAPVRSPVGAARGAGRRGDSRSLSPLLASVPPLVAGAAPAATSKAASYREPLFADPDPRSIEVFTFRLRKV